jgi:hypothetical protein
MRNEATAPTATRAAPTYTAAFMPFEKLSGVL